MEGAILLNKLDLLGQISDNQDSLDMDPQEHSFTRTIDEEAELEERADREREEGHQEQDDEEEDREHEVMTAGSKCTCLGDVRLCAFGVLIIRSAGTFILPASIHSHLVGLVLVKVKVIQGANQTLCYLGAGV